MKIINEFKEFALRGNVVDMAVGIIIGAAFGKIVSSVVSDLLMPPIGKLLGGVNFTDLFVCLDREKADQITSLAQAKAQGVAVIAYGSALQTTIDFVIVAFCLFMLIKLMNRLKSITAEPAPASAPTVKDCPHCCSSISLKATRCPHCTSEL